MPRTIQRITVDELRALLARGGDGQVVDIREVVGYEAERIARSRLIPLSAFAQQAEGMDWERAVKAFCSQEVASSYR